MKIVNGIEMKVKVETQNDFEDHVAGQFAIKETTGFHSATFDEKKKMATIIYLNEQTEERVVRGQKVVKVYVNWFFINI